MTERSLRDVGRSLFMTRAAALHRLLVEDWSSVPDELSPERLSSLFRAGSLPRRT